MSLKKTLIKNSTFNIAGYLYLLIASFISIPILLKNLGAPLFGTYVLLVGLIPLASTIDLGLSPAIVRWLSLPQLSKQQKKRVWQTSFWLFSILSSLVFLIILLMITLILKNIPAFAPFVSHPFFYSTALTVALIIFVNNLNQHLLALPQSQQRFDIYNIRTILIGTSNTFFSAAISYFSANIFFIFLNQFIFHLLTISIFMLYAKNHFQGKSFWPKLHLKTARKLLGFGVKNFIGRLSSQFKIQFSNYALGGLLSATAVATFNIPQNLIIKAAGGISQLTLAFFPMSASLSTKERINKLKKLIISIELLILLLGIIQLFVVRAWGHQFLLWWLKDVIIVTPAFEVLKVLSWFFVLTSLTPIPTAVLDSINYPQVPSFFAATNAVITIILIIILTPIYGILGPAYATVATSSIMAPAFLITFSVIFNRYHKKITS